MQYGLVFVDGTPFDDAIHTKRLLERIGPIRETHYGGFYDFVPDMAKADTAYTNIALPAHTDNTYFTDPAGLQAFHMLSHTPSPDALDGESASGGESLLVDGFRAAGLLRDKRLEYFKKLCRVPLPWHASGNQGVTVTPDELHPVIQLKTLFSKDRKAMRANRNILRIRWNNDDRGGESWRILLLYCSSTLPTSSGQWESSHKVTRSQSSLFKAVPAHFEHKVL